MAVLAADPPDPLMLAMAPPADESTADRWAREQREAQARLISEQIDAQIKAEKSALKKKAKPIKILLLGQSESGKSTTVKNFQIAYAYSSFLQERSAWRAVIHLNLVRSVNSILDVVEEEMARSHSEPQPSRSSSPLKPPTRPPTSHAPSNSITPSTLPVHLSTAGVQSDVSQMLVDVIPFDLDNDADDEGDDDDDDASLAIPAALTDKHRTLQLRLAPLRQVQRDLERSLGAASSEAPEYSGEAAPWVRHDGRAARRTREFFVVSRSGWKSALKRVKAGYGLDRRGSLGSTDEARVETASIHEPVYKRKKASDKYRSRPQSPFGFSTPEDGDEDQGEGEPQAQSAAEVISMCADDMAALWADSVVQDLLIRKSLKARLEEGSGFFLDDAARLAAPGYEPSDEDVVRARLRTMGVQEFRFKFERGPDAGRDWLLYDVGGARSLRHAWLPYFDDITALIFLAPISCFDERLAEDPRVNRLQDSLLIWKAICSSPLLKRVHMILFLNKCDLLQKKLARGVRVVSTVPSYGDRPNDASTVAKYFRQQFKDIFLKYSAEKRPFYAYLTSAIDTKATAITVAAVRDGIHRNYMKNADIL